jgi:hypothetical protein
MQISIFRDTYKSITSSQIIDDAALGTHTREYMRMDFHVRTYKCPQEYEDSKSLRPANVLIVSKYHTIRIRERI